MTPTTQFTLQTMTQQAPSLGAVLAPLHLLFYSTLLGTELYQSLVMTKVCFVALPRSAFTTLQKRVFPLYFKGQAALVLLAAATVPPYGPVTVTQNKLTWISFLVAGVTAVLNLAVYEPRTRKAMIDRIHQETRDSRLVGGDEETARSTPKEPSAEMQKLNRVFSREHAMCIHLNLISMGAMLDNASARWLSLVQIEYQALDGKTRIWEAMRRTTRPKGSAVDAVHIIATRQRDCVHEILLEKQFRPPAGKIVIEFPAGLVDPNESLEECALRELREETGYVGEVVGMEGGGMVLHSVPIDLLPGGDLRDADEGSSCASTVRVRIDLEREENKNPVQKLEEGEIIECFWVPVKELFGMLRKLEAEGFAIDGKVGAFAEGVDVSAKLLG
ncbi:hypothetical protein OQA88_8153 [Cercophora sp. LCS_1]